MCFDSAMRRVFALAVFALLVLIAHPAHALDKVDTYICPTTAQGTGIECFLEAVPQTYTMCRNIKSIEIIEFGLAGAQEGVHGAKTEYCIEKHKISITRPYQAALREAASSKAAVAAIRKLHDYWLESLAQLTPGPAETDQGYKERVVRPYGEFNDQIRAIKTAASAAPKTEPKKAAHGTKSKP